jgi:hypothetical protein
MQICIKRVKLTIILLSYHKIKDNIVYLEAPGSFIRYYIDIVMCFIEIAPFFRLQLLSLCLNFDRFRQHFFKLKTIKKIRLIFRLHIFRLHIYRLHIFRLHIFRLRICTIVRFRMLEIHTGRCVNLFSWGICRLFASKLKLYQDGNSMFF